MNKNPAVSVIIPTYNRAHLVGRAIQSVLNQTYQDFEIIVVDDGSIDNTEEIVNSFDDKRIRYIKHKKNKGAAATRNTGIKNARGEYIAFQDSDDEWLSEKLDEQIKIFKNESNNPGAVYCGVTYIDKKGNSINKKWYPKKKGNIYEDLLYKNCVGGCSNVIVKKECFNQVGLFDENFLLCQDIDMWIRIARCYRFSFAKSCLVKYRIHADNRSKNHNLMIKNINRIQEKYYSELRKRPCSYSRRYFFIGNMLCHLERIREGQSYLLKAISIYPVYAKYYIYLFCSLFGAKGYKFFFNIKQILKRFKNK